MDEQQNPDLESGDDDVIAALQDAEESEATENTEGQADTDQPAEDEADAKAEEEKKTRSQVRRERRKEHEQQLREQAAQALEKAQTAEARLAKMKAAAEGEREPKEEDFSDVIVYAAARAVWEASREAARLKREEIEEEAKGYKSEADRYEETRVAEVTAAWRQQVSEAKERYTDFEQVVYSAPLSDVAVEIILESDMAADVAYHIGSNPALARELSKLHPTAIAREVGRLEAQLSVPKPKTATNAPAPITPVRGSGTPAKDPAKMTPSEYRQWRESGGSF